MGLFSFGHIAFSDIVLGVVALRLRDGRIGLR